MAEEDEIDVLGDFNLDLLSKTDSTIFDHNNLVSQNSDLLNCDYTIHPQWLLDKPSTNPAVWYNSHDDLQIHNYDFEQGNEAHMSTENSINDESGWTEKEKNLLTRGIEIFGNNSINLSQFIGSKTPAEVKYFMKNFYSDMQLSCATLNEENVFDFNYVEETVVTTTEGNDQTASNKLLKAKKTNKGVKRNLDICYENIPSGQSLLKSTYLTNVKQKSPSNNITTKKSVKFKFKTKLKIRRDKIEISKQKIPMRKRKVSTKAIEEEQPKPVAGNGLQGVQICDGEQVIKIQKESEHFDTDSEIDIEDSSNDEEKPPVNVTSSKSNDESVNLPQDNKMEIKEEPEEPLSPKSKSPKKQTPAFDELNPDTIKLLTSEEVPTIECQLQTGEISDVEKYLFHEFFEGRRAKTPMRYLRIRNHILNTWTNVKPNYVTKTSIRQGLKQCGDVNCIGRVHTYLEQIGAINFGCEQVNYVRPLSELAYVPCEKPQLNQPDLGNVSAESLPKQQRVRKKFVNDGEGGYTLTHNETGEVIDTTIVNKEPAKQRYIKSPAIRLIYCRPFTDGRRQEFGITIDLSTLILMDLHAHMYLTEVIGLIGGHWNIDRKLLSITRYEPCKNIATSSLMHCDMCPIAQAKAAERFHSDDLDILGWFHSHPTFAPEPSQQDLETQHAVQQFIGFKKPCVGFILSPFSLHGALIASPYRCLMVVRKGHYDERVVPYKFHVEVNADNLDIDDLLCSAQRIIDYDDGMASNKNKIKFLNQYFLDETITYLDKFIYSVKMHLAKCSNINKMSCDLIIQGLSEICAKANWKK